MQSKTSRYMSTTKESRVKNSSHFTVSAWMVNELNLRGNELIVYSIVHSFSQDGESRFFGSLKYLEDFTGASRPTVIKMLKSLCEKGFIVREDRVLDSVLRPMYYANSKETLLGGSKETLLGGSKETLLGGSKETLPNNINSFNTKIKDIKESDSKIHTPLNDVPNFVKEEQKKIEPHVVKIVPKVEDVEQEMRDSITLKESAIKINKITEKECSEFLEEFFAHTRGYDKEVKSVSDHKRHFLAWLKTQISAKNNKVDYGKKQFTQPVDHIQKRCPEAEDYDF